MDPNETLQRIRAALACVEDAYDMGEEGDDIELEALRSLRDAVTDFDTWLSTGGFLPLAWENFGGAKTGGTVTR